MSEIVVIGTMDNTVDHTFESANRVYGVNGIAPTVNTCGGGGLQAKIMEVQSVAMRGRYSEDGSTSQHLEMRTDEVSNALTTVQKDSLVLETASGIKAVPKEFERFLYEIDGELYLIRIRKLTPRECWRLMGFADNDYDKAAAVNSHTQLYKQAGNSIVRNVLMQVFQQMLKPMSKLDVLKRKALAALNL